MAREAYWSPRISLLIRVLLGGLLVPVLLAFENPASKNDVTQATRFDPLKYLPSGAKIQNRNKDVVFADLDGDGKEEVIVFYTVGDDPNDHTASIMVLNQIGTDYVRLWEDSYDGSWGFADPTGVYDLNKSGKPQIVAYRTVGASCPGSLEIYDYTGGRIRRLTGEWGTNGHCEVVQIKDLDGDGVPEIIISRGHGQIDEVYVWTGKKYLRENGHFPQYYNETLEKLLGAAHSRELFPLSARIGWSVPVVQIYIIQRRYNDALRFCREMLGTIDDASLSQPDSVFTGLKAKAVIYRLLGDTYKAAGKLQKAEEHYQRANGLDAGSK